MRTKRCGYIVCDKFGPLALTTGRAAYGEKELLLRPGYRKAATIFSDKQRAYRLAHLTWVYAIKHGLGWDKGQVHRVMLPA